MAKGVRQPKSETSYKGSTGPVSGPARDVRLAAHTRAMQRSADVDVDVEVEDVLPFGREQVAAYAGDPARAPEWYATIDSVRWQTPPPVAVGSRMDFVAGGTLMRLRNRGNLARLGSACQGPDGWAPLSDDPARRSAPVRSW